MTADSLRLFLAVSVPPVQLDWVAERVAELRARWPEARWVPVQNQHITLKFLGATPEDLLDAVTSACRDVAAVHRPARLRLTGLGVFPSPRRARVLWIGLDDPDRLLMSLARGLDERLAPHGFSAEKRPYSAHLTIARFRVPTAVGELPPVPAARTEFALRAFGLWRSHLSPQGARYEMLSEFPLEGTGTAP